MGRFNPGVYHGTASGNAPDNKLSKIEVAVTLSEDRIEKVEIVSHGEVKGVGYGIPTAPVEALPGLIVKYQSLGVQPIVGAEKSSKAILKAVTAAVAASGANTAALSKPVAPEAFADEERKVGLLVLGGGVGGLAAAVEAKRAGLDVLVIEKAGVTGGSAARSGGKLMAAGTKWQEKQGIYDSPDMLYTYMLEQSRSRADKQKLRFFCDHAYENILWLEGMGYHVQDVECIHESLFPWRVYNSPGGHYMSNGQGGEITTALHHEYERLGGEMIFNCGLESLVRENGRVVGAVCAHTGGGKLTVRADNVILATGGEAQNREYCEKKYGLKGYYTNVPKTNDGTGTRAALAAGAKEYVADGIQVNYCGLTSAIGICEEAGLTVTQEGRRVCNEWTYQYVVGDALRAAGSRVAWYITSGKEPYPAVKAAFARGHIKGTLDYFADSIEELAGKMKVDPEVLKATVDRYNALAEKGVDEDFGKPARFMFPITGPKYAAFQYTPCVTVTYGGLVTDLCARVLDTEDKPIPGFYATGEAASGALYGTVYPGCGTSIGSAILWGRVAARMAAGLSML
jgi:urocanate reductase